MADSKDAYSTGVDADEIIAAVLVGGQTLVVYAFPRRAKVKLDPPGWRET
jgi:hypothetical protein